MIFIIDRMVSGDTHSVFNLAMLNVIDRAFPSENKLFFAEKTHLDQIKNAIAKDVKNRFSFFPKFVNVNSKGTNFFKKLFRLINKIQNDIVFFIFLLKKAKADDYVFFTHIHPVSLAILKLIRLFFKKKKIFVVLHGEVDTIFYRGKGIFNFIGLLYKLIFRLHQRSFYYIVLSTLGAEMLIFKTILKREELVIIHHPYLYTEKSFKLTNFNNKILKIGYIGSLTARKNGSAFVELVKEMDDQIDNGCRFDVIGSVDNEYIDRLSVLKCVRTFSGYLSRSEFESKIKEVDYAIFLFANDQFYIRVSGAFFDAVEFNKPILALRTKYFETIFKEAGDIGFLCDSLREMEDLILNLKKPNVANSQRYSQQKKNMDDYKLKLSLENISKELKEQIRK